MSDQSRLILSPDVPIDALEGAAERAGWEKVMDDPRDGNRPHRVAWEGPWEDLRVYYIDDHLIGVPYLIVRGPDSERALEDVMETLPSHTLDPAIMNALAARESEDKKTAIRRIGVLSGAAEPDPAVLALFDAAFIDPDPEVRRAAIGAATYPAWREFEPRLEILVEHDEDESVRDLAQRALAAFRANEWA